MRLAWLCLLLVVACLPLAPEVPPPPMTLWGQGTHIASAPSAHAPAALAEDGRVWWAWYGYQDEARHYARTTLHDAPVILSLRAFYPFEYMLFAALEGRTHWLWLDRHAETGELRLHFALVNANLVAELGVNTLSSGRTSRYSAVATGNGRVRVVWAEGGTGARTLFTSTLDGRGRATFAQLLARSADFPALLQDSDGTLWLFWHGDAHVWRARLTDNGMADNTNLGIVPALAWGESLESLSVAQDATHVYLFWQIEGADGQPYTRYSAHPHGAMRTPRSQPLAIEVLAGDVATGFNSGQVSRAAFGTRAIGWANPLPLQASVVPMVATQGETLMMLYWQAGELIGAQTLAEVGVLLRPPRLASDAQQHLYVTWSQPHDETVAYLYSTSTRR